MQSVGIWLQSIADSISRIMNGEDGKHCIAHVSNLAKSKWLRSGRKLHLCRFQAIIMFGNSYY